MKIHDITLTIRPGMPVWPGDHPVELYRDEKIEEGANANVSNLSISVHTGTHVDAPYHFLMEGPKVDTLPLNVLVGEVQVVEIPDSIKTITREVVEGLELREGITRVLFKTSNSKVWRSGSDEFYTGFVGIDAGGSQILADKGIRLVGIDYLSISPYKNSRPTHEILLGARMVIIEGLDLFGIEAGVYTLYCLPLKLKDTDGAPARVILVEDR